MTATETTRLTRPENSTRTVGRAAVAGVAAGLVFGVLIQFGLHRMQAIGAMYTLGAPNLSVGWIAHLFHSAVFGAAFGVLADTDAVWEHVRDPPTAVGGGLAFGAALWAVNIVVVWPLWLGAVGLGSAPPLPNLAVMPLVGHLVWGGLLGVLFVVTTR